jgi:hypothetical protein
MNKTENATAIGVGERVVFNNRGLQVQGTVTAIKFSRPGSRNELVKRYGLETYVIRRLVVLPDGTTPGEDASFWTVPEKMCTRIGAGDPMAQGKFLHIKANITRKRAEICAKRRSLADAAGLFGLRPGSDIEVKFRDIGWTRRKFSHVNHGGRVGFYREGEPEYVRFVTANLVRRVPVS